MTPGVTAALSLAVCVCLAVAPGGRGLALGAAARHGGADSTAPLTAARRAEKVTQGCGQAAKGTCFHNPAGRLETVSVAEASLCCAACAATDGCVSWTAWALGQGAGDKMSCNLFSSVAGRQGGNCTSGQTVRPNFIFAFPDTLRAESYGAYGNRVANVTPHLDAFAASGVRFNQAHVMHTQCSPSRCTMLTGRYMHVGGHRTQSHLVQDYEQNYLRALKEAGYFVLYHGKNDAFSQTAFNLSVSEWSNDIGYASGSNYFQYPEPGYFSFLSTGSNTSGADPTASKDLAGTLKAVDWLQHSPPEPFVIFLPSRGAHPPYGAPREWHHKFSMEEVKSAVQLRPRNLTGKPVYARPDSGIPHFRNIAGLSEDMFYEIQRVYLGMISYTDWIFGQLLSGLDAAPGGLANRTAVFFSSDHGDFGGDFGLVEKWPGSMDDVLTRVPLVGRFPGGASGVVHEAPVQTADVFETMLDLAGINASWVRFGQSFAPALQNGTEGEMDRFVYSEGGFYFQNEQMIEANECLSSCPKGLYCPRGQEEAQPNGSPRATMIRNLTAKLVYRPTGTSELYDLKADPRELVNLYASTAPAHQALRVDLTNRLLDWLLLTSDVTPAVLDPRGTPQYPHPIPPDPWAAPEAARRAAHALQPSPADLLAVNGVVQD